MIRIGASLTSSDLLKLSDEIENLKNAGIDFIHFDVMDGHFVPNLTFGPALAKQISNNFSLPIDIHLMVDNPEMVAGWFLKSNPKNISWHVEINADHKKISSTLRNLNISSGLAINPPTDPSCLKPYIHLVDFILLMSVNPGFGGQSFITSVLDKARIIKSFRDLPIYIDGGVNSENAVLVRNAGVFNLISGSYITKSKNKSEAIQLLRGNDKRVS